MNDLQMTFETCLNTCFVLLCFETKQSTDINVPNEVIVAVRFVIFCISEDVKHTFTIIHYAFKN